MQDKVELLPSQHVNVTRNKFVFALILSAAIAFLLAGIAFGKSNHLEHKFSDLVFTTSFVSPATAQAAAASSKLSVAAKSWQNASFFLKTANTLQLHPYCHQNPSTCLSYAEPLNRMLDGVNCERIRNGEFSHNGVDVYMSTASTVLCAGPKFSEKEGSAPPSKSACQIEVSGACFASKSDGTLSVLLGHADMKQRRGQWSLDATAGYSENEGANVHVGLSYSW